MEIKEITNRHEFGSLVNFGNRAVLTIDLAKGKDSYGYKGSKVRVPDTMTEYGMMYKHCIVRWYSDEKKIVLTSGTIGVYANFTYSDAMNDVENANAPIVDAGDTIVLIIHNSETKEIHAYKVKVSERKNIWCSTPLQITDRFELPWDEQ